MRGMFVAILVGLVTTASLVLADPPAKRAPPAAHDGGTARDLVAPSHVPRSLSDAWYYNRLQTTVLENQVAQLNRELARLAADKTDLTARLKVECQVDVVAGDEWSERTLEVTRKGR